MVENKERTEKLKAKVADFPQTPGVYLMKDNENRVLYVGKAKRLRSRVRSYFNPNIDSGKVQILVRRIESIDYILTETEAEAFLLEASLIKKHGPRYNIRLKDDKAYPYIRLSLKDTFPRFYLARKVVNDGSAYFGPYASGHVVKNTIGFLNRSFQIRDCADHFMKSRMRPCMTHQIGACTAPCVDFIDKKTYAKSIKKAKNFLEKQSNLVIKKLKKKMLQLASEQKFELAAQYRDNIDAIERVLEKQAVINAQSTNNQDVIGFHGDKRGTLVVTLHIRQGRMIGQRSQFFSQIRSGHEEIRDWLTSFITQYYQDNVVPDEIYLPVDMGSDITKLLKEVFARRGHTKIKITFPTSTQGRKLIAMANKNAGSHFDSHVSKSEKRKRGLELIASKFKLKTPPRRIECFDISHFQGNQIVGSQVVCEDGVLNPNHYRRYKIRSKKSVDDCRALMEVLSRRLDHEEWEPPDLIVVDGGKGQLNAAVKVLKDVGWSIPVVGLAKERVKKDFKAESLEKTRERFYLPKRQNPVFFPEKSEAFKILVSLRNEAHDFAIRFHRKKLGEQSLWSQLDQVKGLGPTLTKALLHRFGSVQKIKKASVVELCELSGISQKLASEILRVLDNHVEQKNR